jgi:hypothetical protein
VSPEAAGDAVEREGTGAHFLRPLFRIFESQ